MNSIKSGLSRGAQAVRKHKVLAVLGMLALASSARADTPVFDPTSTITTLTGVVTTLGTVVAGLATIYAGVIVYKKIGKYIGKGA
jgi:hypothetical protein